MSSEEQRRAIELPAQRGDWKFEPGLVDLFLRDVGEEPGALPLLSHALLETWRRRRGRTLTLQAYAESGGVRGAIARTAESLFHDHEPANRAGLTSCWIYRRHGDTGFGATMKPSVTPTYQFRFTSMMEMAKAHQAELAQG